MLRTLFLGACVASLSQSIVFLLTTDTSLNIYSVAATYTYLYPSTIYFEDRRALSFVVRR